MSAAVNAAQAVGIFLALFAAFAVVAALWAGATAAVIFGLDRWGRSTDREWLEMAAWPVGFLFAVALPFLVVGAVSLAFGGPS